MTNPAIICQVSILLLGSALAAAGAPAAEQWLEYHTTSQPNSYHRLTLTTNPPPNVTLPKLRASPLFGCWKNGWDKGRWFVLDRAQKGGRCDRIVIDSNGNNRLDDETAISGTQNDDFMIRFPPLKLVFKGEDGPVTYHLLLQFYQYDEDNSQLYASAGGWYEGMINLAGKQRRVQLFDNNVNGIFNDHSLTAAESDRMTISGSKRLDYYLGRLLEIDGELLRIEVARDGACIKAQKADGIEFGLVHLPSTISSFEAIGDNGHFVRSPSDGEIRMPVGKYRIHRWNIQRKDKEGSAWQLSGSGFSQAGDFEVTTGKPVELAVGEPIRPQLEAIDGRGTVRFNLRLSGVFGETVDITKGETRPRAPQLQLAGQTGGFRSTSAFEYG